MKTGDGSGGDTLRCLVIVVGILSLLFVSSGCSGIQATYIPLREGHFQPTRPAKDISLIAGDFKEPYEELGIIIVRKYPGSLEEEIQEKMREEAVMRGADAVIRIRAEKQSFFSLSPFFLSFPFPGIEVKGVAIRFKKEEK